MPPLNAAPPFRTPEQVADKVAPPGSSPLAKLIGNLDHRPVRVLPFPGFEGATVALWALTDDESRAAVEDATSTTVRTRKLTLELARSFGLFDQEVRVQTLLRAMRHPDAPALPFAASADEVRKLSNDVQDALMAAYLEWLDERSPLKKLNPDQLDAQIDALCAALGKGEPAAALVSFYDTGTLRQLLLRSAHRLLSATKGSSSGSSSASVGLSPSSGLSAVLDSAPATTSTTDETPADVPAEPPSDEIVDPIG